MSLALTAGIQTAKDSLSKQPVWILEMDFATGTIYVGPQTLTINNWGGQTITLKPWVRRWGKLDDALPVDPFQPPSFTGDLIAQFAIPGQSEAPNTLWWNLTHSVNLPEQTTVKLYEWYETLNASTDPPLQIWQGRFEDWYWIDEHTLEVRFTDTLLQNEKVVGTAVDLGIFPNASNQTLGRMCPIIYGYASNVPCYPVAAGAVTTLYQDAASGATTLYYSNPPPAAGFTTGLVPDFPSSGTIVILGDSVNYSAKGTATLGGITVGTFTVTATVNAYAAGARILQSQNQWDFVAADHPVKSLSNVYVNAVRVGGWSQVTDANNRTLVRFTAYPSIARKVALLVSGATGTTTTGNQGQGDLHATGQLPSSWTQTNQTIANSGPTTMTIATFPNVANMYKQSVHLKWSTFTVTYLAALQVKLKMSTVTVTIFDSNLNTNTPADVVAEIADSGDTITVLTSGGGSNWSVSMTVDTTCSRIPATSGLGTLAVSLTGGAATLSGLQVSDALIDQLSITFDAQGYQDDGGGTYTGTASALINNARDVIRHFLVIYGGYAIGNVSYAPTLAARQGTLYTLNGVFITQDKFTKMLAQLAWESGILVKDIAGTVTLTEFRRLMTPDFIVNSSRMRFLQKTRQTLDRKRVPIGEVMNRVWVRFQRNWTLGKGQNGYKNLYKYDDTGSQTRYGTLERPDKFMWDFVTTTCHADALGKFYFNVFKVRREFVKFRQGTHGLGKVFGDVVRLQDRMMPYGTGQILSADLEPGDAIQSKKTIRDIVLYFIQEGEAMLNIYDKTCSSGYTLVNPMDMHTIFTNLGSTGLMNFYAPTATPRGQRYGPFFVASTGGLNVYPATGEVITRTFNTTESTGYLGSVPPVDLPANIGLASIAATSGVGSWFEMICYSTGKWQLDKKVGLFTSST